MEFIFETFGDAHWALDQFTQVGESKGYVSWTDILKICKKTKTFIGDYVETIHRNEGWIELGDSHIDPVDENNWNDKWKLVLPPIKKLKFKGGEIIRETRNSKQSNKTVQHRKIKNKKI